MLRQGLSRGQPQNRVALVNPLCVCVSTEFEKEEVAIPVERKLGSCDEGAFLVGTHKARTQIRQTRLARYQLVEDVSDGVWRQAPSCSNVDVLEQSKKALRRQAIRNCEVEWWKAYPGTPLPEQCRKFSVGLCKHIHINKLQYRLKS